MKLTPRTSILPYTTLFRSQIVVETVEAFHQQQEVRRIDPAMAALRRQVADTADAEVDRLRRDVDGRTAELLERSIRRILADRKSTRLNSSHVASSYAVFCL